MDELSSAVHGFSEFVLDFAIALAGIGVLSMAILEVLKRLFGFRERWHRRRVWEWVNGSTEPFLSEEDEDDHRRAAESLGRDYDTVRAQLLRPDPEQAYRDLVHLATGTARGRVTVPGGDRGS